MMQQAAEVTFAQRSEIDHRIGAAQLPEDQPDQAGREENGQRLHPPEWIAQPVPLLALAEHHFPADHDDDQQRQTDRVEMERPPPQLRTLFHKIFRVAEKGVTSGKRQKTDRHIDQKDPPPLVLVRQPATQGRTDDRREQGRQAEQRHRHALLFPREGVEQNRLAAGLQTAACQTLDDAEQDQLTETAGHSAQSGTESKNGNRHQKVVAATKMRAQPPGDRQDDGVGGKVAGENPFAVIDRRRQTAGDIAQRHHRDGGVEHLHEGRHHDDGGHQPRVRRHGSS